MRPEARGFGTDGSELLSLRIQERAPRAAGLMVFCATALRSCGGVFASVWIWHPFAGKFDNELIRLDLNPDDMSVD